ncbi:acid protease [Epithele typhae]|uniref:acid protease n=1 Tax=Epithele typhae TaxID=378194 RepID=UPI002007E8FA|nr:acid protease [Epithele typhae]KAH9929057.1 acid protease [Epithele typhae]
MFFNAILPALSLTLLSQATPVPEARPLGVNIPLHKRGSLTTPHGVFDHAMAVKHGARIANKYRRNLINIKANTGHLPDGVESIPDSKVAAHPLKRAGVPLTDEDHDVQWAGKVAIGTPSTTFLIDFDTGSSDLWVPSSTCTSCGSHKKYNPARSSTSSKKSGTFEIGYGDGSSASGPIYTDTVTVGGIKATGQYFSAVTTESSEFTSDVVDGLMGLAFPQLSNLKHKPFFNTAFSQGTAKQNVFGFKLATTGSELYLGGTNSALYTGALEYHPVSPSSLGFWQITGASAFANGARVASGFQTVIDSGTTIMYGPPAAVKAFYAAVPGAKVFDAANGLYQYPCARAPSVAFSWGPTGKAWAVSKNNFSLGVTRAGSTWCVGALAGQDFGLGSNVWLLGDSFMKNVYTAFSFARNSVGFAKLK